MKRLASVGNGCPEARDACNRASPSAANLGFGRWGAATVISSQIFAPKPAPTHWSNIDIICTQIWLESLLTRPDKHPTAVPSRLDIYVR
jgi:hypothetical protein